MNIKKLIMFALAGLFVVGVFTAPAAAQSFFGSVMNVMGSGAEGVAQFGQEVTR